MKILVYIQQDEGKINSVSLEALKGSQEIAAQTGGTVSALSFNSDITSQLAGYNVSEVLLAEDDKLNTFNPLFYLNFRPPNICNDLFYVYFPYCFLSND